MVATWNTTVKDDIDSAKTVRGEVDKMSQNEVHDQSDQHQSEAIHGDRNITEINHFTTQCNNLVCGMVSYQDHLFIVHYEHDILYTYDEEGTLKKTFPISDHMTKCVMTSPWGICLVQEDKQNVLGKNETLAQYWEDIGPASRTMSQHKPSTVSRVCWVVISDPNGQCLWWLSTEKEGDLNLGQPQQYKLEYRPCGVSTYRTERALVADWRNNRVYVYSHPGQHVTCLQLSHDMRPLLVLADQSDGYVVKHGSPCQVSWENRYGEVTRYYTDQPNVCAFHIADIGKYLLISDKNITVFTKWLMMAVMQVI